MSNDGQGAGRDCDILVSFCVPTYRRPKLLAAALRSILALRGLDHITYEIVVSDDDENDNLQVRLEGEFPPTASLRFHKNQPHGQFFNLNNLVQLARGRWLVFLHDDDVLHEEFLERFVDAGLARDPRMEAVWYARQLIGAQGNLLRRLAPKKPASPTVRVSGIKYVRRCLARDDHTLSGTVIPPMVTGLIIRRDLVLRAGAFPTHLVTMGDGLFLFRALSEAEEICYIDAPMVLYRVYVGTQRSAASEKGYVYGEFKTMVLDAIQFSSVRIGESERLRFIAEATCTFYRSSLGLNGPITWLALHYRGSAAQRIALVRDILRDVHRYSARVLLRHFPFAPLALHLMPRRINRLLARLYVGY